MTYLFNYKDYLSATIGDSIKTSISFSNPDVLLPVVDHEMSFRSDLTKDRINEQAGFFSTRFCKLIDPSLRSTFLSDRNTRSVQARLSKAYIYSAYKVVFYHLLYEESAINSLFLTDPGYMFSGHLALLNLLGKNYTTCYNQVERVTLRKSLTGIGSDSCKSIINSETYKGFLQGNGSFFDSECERLLDEINRGYSSIIATSLVSDGYYISGDESPLGNMCVNSNGDNLIVTGYGSIHDHPSIYWNSALGITLVNGDEVGTNGSFYLNCGQIRSPRVLQREVESITNLRFDSTPYPFEYNDSPGSGPNYPSPGGGSPRGNQGPDGGSRDDDNGSHKPTNPNRGRGSKDSPGSFGRKRNNNTSNVVNKLNFENRSSNNSKTRDKISKLLSDSVKFVTSPGNLERSLIMFNQIGQLSLTREQLNSIKSEAKLHSYSETNFQSQKFDRGPLKFERIKSNSKEVTSSDSNLNLSFVSN
jgi:hypothetical protein